MNLRDWKRQLFEAFRGDWDADEALRAGHALDPTCAHAYTDQAITRQLTTDYKTWLRTQVKRVHKDSGNRVERLFDVDEKVELRTIRSTFLIAGVEYPLETLSGDLGAEVLREVAQRDERAAKTMLSRCSTARRLADELERLSKKLGRPVTVAELLEERAA